MAAQAKKTFLGETSKLSVEPNLSKPSKDQTSFPSDELWGSIPGELDKG